MTCELKLMKLFCKEAKKRQVRTFKELGSSLFWLILELWAKIRDWKKPFSVYSLNTMAHGTIGGISWHCKGGMPGFLQLGRTVVWIWTSSIRPGTKTCPARVTEFLRPLWGNSLRPGWCRTKVGRCSWWSRRRAFRTVTLTPSPSEAGWTKVLIAECSQGWSLCSLWTWEGKSLSHKSCWEIAELQWLHTMLLRLCLGCLPWGLPHFTQEKTRKSS